MKVGYLTFILKTIFAVSTVATLDKDPTVPYIIIVARGETGKEGTFEIIVEVR